MRLERSLANLLLNLSHQKSWKSSLFVLSYRSRRGAPVEELFELPEDDSYEEAELSENFTDSEEGEPQGLS